MCEWMLVIRCDMRREEGKASSVILKVEKIENENMRYVCSYLCFTYKEYILAMSFRLHTMKLKW